MREIFAGFFFHQRFIFRDDGLQIFGAEIGIELGFDLVFAGIEDVIELRHVDMQRDFAEHLNEAAVAIVGEARVAGFGDQAFGAGIVQAEVENGVHHAGHGELGAGTNAHQERIGCAAELFAHELFELGHGFVNLVIDFFGHFVAIFKEEVTNLSRDGEARGHRHAGLAHLGEACAFAAQNLFHGSVAVGRASAKRVNVFLHLSLLSPGGGLPPGKKISG